MGSNAVSTLESWQKATQACQGEDGKTTFLAVEPDFFQAGTTPVQWKENQLGS